MAEELPDELRQRADEVLSQPKFQAAEPGLLDRAWDRVLEFIGDLLSVVTGGTSFGGVAVGWFILAVMIGLILYFLVRFLPRSRRTRMTSAVATVDVRSNRQSRKEWLAEAERAEAAGQHREAVRARYRATVAGLVEGDELPDTPGATVSELAEAFEAEPARTDPFASSTDAFSDVWYGDADADRSSSDQAARWDEQVLSDRGRS